MIRSTEPGSRQVGFCGRLGGRGSAAVVLTLMAVGVVTVCDALASRRPAGPGAAAVTQASLVASPSTRAATVACETVKAAVVVQLATDADAQQADSNAYEPDGSSEADPSEVARFTEKLENGVLVVRHGPTETPVTTRDDAGDQALGTPDDAVATLQGVLVCRDGGPWPCDPLWNVRGPAEGFHKNERWAYHRLSFKYHPTDFTYHPTRDFAYQPTRDFTYQPKRDWTYHPQQRR